MSCFPHRVRQVLPLIKHSWVNCTQLCIIHQAFLSMEDVFIIHTRQHFKLTHHKLVSKRHPFIGSCLLHQDHRQQQERGTRDCRRILITSWPCPKMWKNGMVAATIFPKNFVSHHTTSWKPNNASLFKGNGVLVIVVDIIKSSAFSTLLIFHIPQLPHSTFSTLRVFHTLHFPYSSFSTLFIFHTLHFPHSSFSTLFIFHTPAFLHSALRTPVFHQTSYNYESEIMVNYCL